ncbi:hypothetical protein L1887_50255 [Cichorium endivia]|nr:hypothetical protein L1887_50255 [Cichorium endivia]
MLDGLLRRWLVDKGVVDEEDIEVDELVRWVRQGTAQLCCATRCAVSGRLSWSRDRSRPFRLAQLAQQVQAGPGMGSGAAASNEGKKNRFSKLMKGSSRPTNASAPTGPGASSLEARAERRRA